MLRSILFDSTENVYAKENGQLERWVRVGEEGKRVRVE